VFKMGSKNKLVIENIKTYKLRVGDE